MSSSLRRALWPLVLSLLPLGLSGCGSSPLLYYAPTAESVRVVLKDSRPDALPFYGGGLGLALPMIPFVPYGTREEQPFLTQAMREAILGNLARTNAFREVLGPDDPYALQQEAELELEVRLLHLRDRRITTTYGLGFPGVLLWLIGIPQDIATAEVALELTWRLEGQEPYTTEGASSERSFHLVYVDSSAKAKQRAYEVIGQALDQAIRRGVGVLRQQQAEKRQHEKKLRRAGSK